MTPKKSIIVTPSFQSDQDKVLWHQVTNILDELGNRQDKLESDARLMQEILTRLEKASIERTRLLLGDGDKTGLVTKVDMLVDKMADIKQVIFVMLGAIIGYSVIQLAILVFSNPSP